MKRARILDPADRARFEASRQTHPATNAATRAEAATPAAAHTPMAPLPASGISTTPAPVPTELNPPAPGAPLGDVARYYRAKKLQREASERAEAAHASPAPRASVPAAARPRVNNPVRVAPPLEATPARAANLLAVRTRREEILVQRGDTLWGLARQHLGKGSRWTELAAANPTIGDPHRLQAGAVIRLPASLQAEGSKISVRAGDTLWSLAAAKYGRGASWTCIASANPQLENPDLIQPGQALMMPASCARLP
jgi:nucleoid-associated protein YgaU